MDCPMCDLLGHSYRRNGTCHCGQVKPLTEMELKECKFVQATLKAYRLWYAENRKIYIKSKGKKTSKKHEDIKPRISKKAHRYPIRRPY